MPLLSPPLTKDDFINSDWQDVVNSSDRKICRSYHSIFWQKALQAKESGRTREQNVFEILAYLTSVDIKPETTEEFFANQFQNLTDEHLDFLAGIAVDVSDSELQARIADVLWAKRRDYRMAQLAVTAYLKSATQLADPEKWTHCFDRIERSLRLARRIKYQTEEVATYIEDLLNHLNGEDPSWLSAKLMQLLQRCQLGDSVKCIPLAEKAATLAESTHDWRRARTLWEIKAVWHRTERDNFKEREASMLAAETYVQEAQDFLQKTPPSYLAASHFMQQAVEAFRSIRGTREETIDAKSRSEEVHRLLLQYQEESRNELIASSQEIDISEMIEQARAYVKGKDFQDALFALSLLGSPSNVSQLRQQVQEHAREFIASHIAPKVIMNEKGKVTARQPGSFLSDDPNEVEAVTRFEMNQNAIYYQTLHAQAYVESAIYQINLEHSVRINDLLPIVSHNPFIPTGREYLFAKGLYAGLDGDFLTSTHILIPQIENSIRYLLWQKGVITSGLDDSGIQNEHNLNSTLYRPELASIFNEDTLFDLQCLLVEHSGSNLRNRMAHGLINDGEFSHPIMVYLWWLTLRLCCLPILHYQQSLQKSDPWVKFAGMFKDDPLFDEFVEDMASYRRELDSGLAEHEVSSMENQSA
ncbi:DUF4209 domain-containing protein [Pseudanabaena sp. PCC 6802]|uniref:DUF4209 domain-containing protein n=1 Tax=Pseudanabaena sp. PCC 6802 TaxID=118173 RepID=UPI000347BF17|nr:DUF4209 domain-containing protein [Pseudanabaena sp. PCC 6802]